MLCYARLVKPLTDTHHYSPFPTWQPKWFPFHTNQIVTGSCLRTSLHWLPMTIRIASKFLIIRSWPCMTLLPYFRPTSHFHLVLLCLPCLPHQSLLAFQLFIARATSIPISGPLHFLFPPPEMLLSLIVRWLAPNYSRCPSKCRPVREAFPDHSLCTHCPFPSHYPVYDFHCLQITRST